MTLTFLLCHGLLRLFSVYNRISCSVTIAVVLRKSGARMLWILASVVASAVILSGPR